MKINYISIKNFLSIGETPVEIDFTKYGNIINIKGRNLDVGEGASNASGKTTILEAIVYGFYGKLLKGLNHKEAINIKAKKGLEVEIRWDNYRLLRKREPNRLQLWDGDKDISLGGIPATEELIRNIVGLDYNSFINVSCFGQHNLKPFLGCDAAEKRHIAENLLSLDKYQKYHKLSKDKSKSIKDKINQLSSLYQTTLSEIGSCHKRKTTLLGQNQTWRRNKLNEIAEINNKINSTSESLTKIRSRNDVKQYEKAQEDLAILEVEVQKREKNRVELYSILSRADTAIAQTREEKQNYLLEVSNYERDLSILAGDIFSGGFFFRGKRKQKCHLSYLFWQD